MDFVDDLRLFERNKQVHMRSTSTGGGCRSGGLANWGIIIPKLYRSVKRIKVIKNQILFAASKVLFTLCSKTSNQLFRPFMYLSKYASR